jgi:hypothetical protein
MNALPGNSTAKVASISLTDPDNLRNFYGRTKEPKVHYVREMKRPDYGKAPEEEYTLEYLEEGRAE